MLAPLFVFHVFRRQAQEHDARVAELADALDLGSSTLTVWGFDSPLSHQL